MPKLPDDLIENEISKNSAKAEELLKDQDKLERFLERLERKLQKIPVVGSSLSAVPILISLVRSYAKKEYTDIPIGSIIAIIGSLIYLFSHFDLIPDSIPVIGLADDAAVITAALKLVKDDVDEYKDWQKKNGYAVLDYAINDLLNFSGIFIKRNRRTCNEHSSSQSFTGILYKVLSFGYGARIHLIVPTLHVQTIQSLTKFFIAHFTGFLLGMSASVVFVLSGPLSAGSGSRPILVLEAANTPLLTFDAVMLKGRFVTQIHFTLLLSSDQLQH